MKLHYLKNSCAQRVAWLLAELDIDYEIVVYDREPKTGIAPKELKQKHPLQKSPVLEDGNLVLAESAAIIEHILDRYDSENRLTPPKKTDDYSQYLFWTHNAASIFSAAFLGGFLAKAADLGAYQKYAEAQLGLYLDNVENNLKDKTWIVGDKLTGADFAISFPLQWAIRYFEADKYPHIRRYVAQIESTPSYKRIAQKTGYEMQLSKIA